MIDPSEPNVNMGYEYDSDTELLNPSAPRTPFSLERPLPSLEPLLSVGPPPTNESVLSLEHENESDLSLDRFPPKKENQSSLAPDSSCLAFGEFGGGSSFVQSRPIPTQETLNPSPAVPEWTAELGQKVGGLLKRRGRPPTRPKEPEQLVGAGNSSRQTPVLRVPESREGPSKERLYESPNVGDKRVQNAKQSRARRVRKKEEESDLRQRLEKLIKENEELRAKNEEMRRDLGVMDTFVLASIQMGKEMVGQIKDHLLSHSLTQNIRSVIFYPGLLQQIRTRTSSDFSPDSMGPYAVGTVGPVEDGRFWVDAVPVQILPGVREPSGGEDERR